MSFYQPVLNTINGWTGINRIVDFSQTDPATGVAPDVSGNGRTATLGGGWGIISSGVEFNGQDTYADMATYNPAASTAVVIMKPYVIDLNQYLIDQVASTIPNRRKQAFYIENNQLTMNYVDDGEHFKASAPGAFTLDDMYTCFKESTQCSYGDPHPPLSISGSTLLDEQLQFVDSTARIGAHRGGEAFANSFNGLMGIVIIFDRRLSQAEQENIASAVDIIGTIDATTNLESARRQEGVVLNDARETVAAYTCPAGQTTFSTFVHERNNQTLDFVAFDTDAGKTFLHTDGLVIQSATPTLAFTAISGSGGGGGTGLVAHIAGTVNIDGTAAEREVIVISDDPNGRTVLGEGVSAADGTFDIEYADWGGAVIALALDNYGGNWAPSTALALGTIIHPTVPNGYVYEVTSGGTTGTEEPTWSINSAVSDGSVTYNPKPFYRPIASGPLQGEVLPEPE